MTKKSLSIRISRASVPLHLVLAALVAASACGTFRTPVPEAPRTPSAQSTIAAPPEPSTQSPPRGSSTLALGQYHTCALDRAGLVRCFGANNLGQLGDGTLRTRLEPTAGFQPEPGARVVQLAAGGTTTYALTDTGNLYHFGADPYECVPQKPVTLVRRFEPLHDIRSISVSPTHACAVDGRGVVSCWSKICGNRDDPPRAPMAVGVDDALSVTVGGIYGCALRRGGEIRCFAISPSHETPCAKPRSIPQLEGAVELRASGAVLCARFPDGTSGCGEIHERRGSGDSICKDEFSWRELSFDGPVAQLAVGDSQVCAALTRGGVHCTDIKAGETAQERTVTGTDFVVELVAGARHTCARKASGEIVCWGDNKERQLGDPTATLYQPVPTQVPGLRRIAELEVGVRSCGRDRDGRVLCWGEESSAPVELVAARGALEVAPGYLTCIRDPSNTLRCWNYDEPRPDEPALGAVRAIDVSWSYGCAVDRRGRIVCFGFQPPGMPSADVQIRKLSEHSTTVTCTSQEHKVAFAELPPARDVSAGASHVCALTTRGEVYCFGDNTYGQLGTSQARPSSCLEQPRLDAVRAGELRDVVEVDAGGAHTCARTKNGRVYCFGRNDAGQLGDGTTESRPTPTPVPGIDDAIDIAAGDASTCIVRKGGEVYCFGDNTYGQLGDGTFEKRLTPTKVLNIEDALSVGSDNRTTCALTRGGTVWCFGDNQYGALGLGTQLSRAEPVTVPINGPTVQR